MSPQGADSLNSVYISDSSVYYFSFATYATKLSKDKSKHIPGPNMSMLLRPTSRLMGSNKHYANEWYENDGICNTVSMYGPNGSLIKEFDGIPKKGVWQVMPKLNIDHQEVIGHLVNKKDFENIIVLYKNHLGVLGELK